MKQVLIHGMQKKIRHIHFVGIGGIGMSGIAEVLLNLRYIVSGSDLSESDITQRLRTLGAKIFQGHREEQIEGADVLVISTAVRPTNPEVEEAYRRNIPVIPRAEMLSELLKMKFSVAVSGSHGKTSTTSMISAILAHGGLDPTMVIGGKLGSIGSNAKLGGGAIIVAEADESDGSFLALSPDLAVITNIDREHLDHYRDIGEIKSAFLQFANSVPFYSITVVCTDNERVQEILPQIKRKTVTYGLVGSADYMAENIRLENYGSRFYALERNIPLGEIVLHIPGRFNIVNALAAIAVAREFGLTFDVIREGLALFEGVQRRLQVKAVLDGVTIVDDYGHHPTEIQETLIAAKEAWKHRLIVVFQPHRFSRTLALLPEFSQSFTMADQVILMDIYSAGEEPIQGVSSQVLRDILIENGHRHVSCIHDPDSIVEYLMEIVHPTDTVITLGAGNVWTIGEMLVKRLRGENNTWVSR